MVWRAEIDATTRSINAPPVARHPGARNCIAASHAATGIRSSNAPRAVAMASRLVRPAGSSKPCATNPLISVFLTSKGTTRMPPRRR